MGIAIGAGTDVAVETAGVVLVKTNPADVAGSVRLTRAVRGKIKQNRFWAAIYNSPSRSRRASCTPAWAYSCAPNGPPC